MLGTFGPVLGIALVGGLIYLCHKRGIFKKSASQEQALTMTLQKLERSPTASKRPNDERSTANGAHAHNSYNCTPTLTDLHLRASRSPLHHSQNTLYMNKQQSYPPSPVNHGGGGYTYPHSPHTLRMPPGRIAAYHMVVNTDSDDNHSVHATV